MFYKIAQHSKLVGNIIRNYNKLNLFASSLPISRKMSSQKAAACTDIVWMDLEMTGLDVKTDKILEVACIITDKELNVLSEGPCFAINHASHIYEDMNEWCKKHHNESGLINRCKNSSIKPEQAEGIVLDYLKRHIPERKCPLAGNSVYMDRLFLKEYMPLVNEHLHYRIIDASTIKELARRWNPDVLEQAPKKRFAHRALEDIMDSINELKYYRKCFFQTPNENNK